MPSPHAVTDCLTTRGAAHLSELCALTPSRSIGASPSVEAGITTEHWIGESCGSGPSLRPSGRSGRQRSTSFWWSLRQAAKESRAPWHTACVQGHNCISVRGARRAYPHSEGGCRRGRHIGARPDLARAGKPPPTNSRRDVHRSSNRSPRPRANSMNRPELSAVVQVDKAQNKLDAASARLDDDPPGTQGGPDQGRP